MHYYQSIRVKNIAKFLEIFDKLHQKIKYMHLNFLDFYYLNSLQLNIDIELLVSLDFVIINSIVNDFQTKNFTIFFGRQKDVQN